MQLSKISPGNEIETKVGEISNVSAEEYSTNRIWELQIQLIFFF